MFVYKNNSYSQIQSPPYLIIAGLIVCLSACAQSNIPEPLLTESAVTSSTDMDNAQSQWANDTEYNGQIGLSMINASHAYDAGYSGKNVSIGIVDTGIDMDHAEFSTGNVMYYNQTALGDNPSNEKISHGTSVASIIAGARGTGDKMHGVAFDAHIAMWGINSDNGILDLDSEILTNAYSRLEQLNTKIVNNSWGYDLSFAASGIATYQDYLYEKFGNAVDIMRNNETIYVWAGGNQGNSEVAVSAAWAALFPEMAGRSIAVVAANYDGTIYDQSNRCGSMAAHCITAPGGIGPTSDTHILTAQAGGGYKIAAGTSIAVPHISGTLAVMYEVFGDQLTPQEYVARLFATANKSGIYAQEEIYGQGMVDIQAAISPIGDLHIPTQDGTPIAPDAFAVTFTTIPDDVVARIMTETIIAVDDMNTPFPISLGTLIEPDVHTSVKMPRRYMPHPPIPDTHITLGGLQFSSWHMPHFTTHMNSLNSPFDTPYLTRLIDDDMHTYAHMLQTNNAKGTLSVIGFAARQNSAPAQNKTHARENDNKDLLGTMAYVTLAHIPDHHFMMGFIGESNGVLGLSGAGDLTINEIGKTVFIQANGHYLLSSDMQFDYRLGAGLSHMGAPDGSLISGMTHTLTSNANIGLQYGLDKHIWRLDFAQSLHFENGALKMTLPYYRQQNGEILFADTQFDLSNSTRPFALTAAYIFHGSTYEIETYSVFDNEANNADKGATTLGVTLNMRF